VSAEADDCIGSEDDWVGAMRAGDFARAWIIADRDLARLCAEGPAKHVGPRHQQRIWRGEELRDRSVLVRCYHGLGDTIQFARFLPALKRVAREVIVWCQPSLVELVRRVPGVDRVLPLHDGAPQVPFDLDIEIMELPHALRAGLDLIAMPSAYLAAPRPPAGQASCGLYTVGLVWRVGAWDKRREVPARLLRQLALPGVRLCALQRDVTAAEVGETGAIDVSTADIDSLALRLQQLDLVISVDTMVAHLAGALDREVWIMLHTDCDWRWPASGSRTYWYRRARLFRQHTPGDWGSVIAEIRAALQARLTVSAAASSAPSADRSGLAIPASTADAGGDSRA
jgi:hypothetical protein